MLVGPCLRPERLAGNIADGTQLWRHVRRHHVRVSFRQVRSQEVVRDGACHPGTGRLPRRGFTQLLRLHRASLYCWSNGTGAPLTYTALPQHDMFLLISFCMTYALICRSARLVIGPSGVCALLTSNF